MAADRFSRLLVKYVNGGCLRRVDVAASLFFEGLPFYYNAKRIMSMFDGFRRGQKQVSVEPVTLNIDVYRGKNPYVLGMMAYLDSNLREDLLGAYVHGSLGTSEEVPYSDFDALVIIRDEVFDNRSRLVRAARRLHRARRFMVNMDPLQHHGWFVLAEAHLGTYPQHYLPFEILEHARSLCPRQGTVLSLHPVWDHREVRASFFSLSHAILRRIRNRRLPGNLYSLKGVLSEFMLLPSLYCQVRDRCGIFKRDSFASAGKDFSDAEWRIMDEVTAIREGWHFRPGFFQKRVLRSISPLVTRFKKRIALKIPVEIEANLTPDFFPRMALLIGKMQAKLQDVEARG